ncbi:hypothetical protein C1H46_015195 [Malus baccata]|uniref:Uncharacterized protein n=1 Tax=Malus baccata TaxID=106549 RepID=A0A540MK88_MALBA|nr:hypothetical protein C1H46_015195 [Malus baccata]
MKTDSSSATKITKKSKIKKIDRIESSLKESNRDLSLFKFKSDTVITLVVFGLLNSLFEGKVVAKLNSSPLVFGPICKSYWAFRCREAPVLGLFPIPDPKTN